MRSPPLTTCADPLQANSGVAPMGDPRFDLDKLTVHRIKSSEGIAVDQNELQISTANYLTVPATILFCVTKPLGLDCLIPTRGHRLTGDVG